MESLLEPPSIWGEIFETRTRGDHVDFHLDERGDDEQHLIDECFASNHLQEISLAWAWSWLRVELLNTIEVMARGKTASKERTCDLSSIGFQDCIDRTRGQSKGQKVVVSEIADDVCDDLVRERQQSLSECWSTVMVSGCRLKCSRDRGGKETDPAGVEVESGTELVLLDRVKRRDRPTILDLRGASAREGRRELSPLEPPVSSTRVCRRRTPIGIVDGRRADQWQGIHGSTVVKHCR